MPENHKNNSSGKRKLSQKSNRFGISQILSPRNLRKLKKYLSKNFLKLLSLAILAGLTLTFLLFHDYWSFISLLLATSLAVLISWALKKRYPKKISRRIKYLIRLSASRVRKLKRFIRRRIRKPILPSFDLPKLPRIHLPNPKFRIPRVLSLGLGIVFILSLGLTSILVFHDSITALVITLLSTYAFFVFILTRREKRTAKVSLKVSEQRASYLGYRLAWKFAFTFRTVRTFSVRAKNSVQTRIKRIQIKLRIFSLKTYRLIIWLPKFLIKAAAKFVSTLKELGTFFGRTIILIITPFAKAIDSLFALGFIVLGKSVSVIKLPYLVIKILTKQTKVFIIKTTGLFRVITKRALLGLRALGSLVINLITWAPRKIKLFFLQTRKARKAPEKEARLALEKPYQELPPPPVAKSRARKVSLPQLNLSRLKRPLAIGTVLALAIFGLIISFNNFGKVRNITPDTFKNIFGPEEKEEKGIFQEIVSSQDLCSEFLEGALCQTEPLSVEPAEPAKEKLLARGPISEPEGEVLGIKEELERKVVGAEGVSRAEYVAPPANPVGQALAAISLFFGLIFFLYSIKYYLGIAVILLFGRGGNGNNYNNNNGKKNGSLGIFGELLKNNGTRNGKANGRLNGLFNSVFRNNGLNNGNNLKQVNSRRQPFISIHLPFYNEKKVVNRILTACTSLDYRNYEVIVIDDSTDETVDILEKWKKHPRVKVIHREERTGYKGGALKVALEQTDPRAEFVTVFDADFVPYPDTLLQFLRYFELANQGLENYRESNLAAVQGYQWHVLNKGENWITQAVRSEFAGSYVVERPSEEIAGSLKQIAGSVYMIRADLLKSYGWTESITEDFELTLRLYRDGYEVLYTPYVQSPSECVSTLKRLIRQRMRWAEGHTNNIRKYFWSLLRSKKPTLRSKLEFLYLTPYYLQSAFFLLGTTTWFVSDVLMHTSLPFWTALWGWSLVFTNLLSLPLMNSVGLFLEESDRKDYSGVLSFVALTYLLVPFQAYAALRGLLKREEGPWFRTPKTGKITDDFFKVRSRFRRWFRTLFPGGSRRPSTVKSEKALHAYFTRTSSYSDFKRFRVKRKSLPFGLGRAIIASLLIIGILVGSFASDIQFSQANPDTFKFLDNWSSHSTLDDTATNAYRRMDETYPTEDAFEGVKTVSDNPVYFLDPTDTGSCGAASKDQNSGFEANGTGCWLISNDNKIVIKHNATTPSCTHTMTVGSSYAHDGTYGIQAQSSCVGNGAIYSTGPTYNPSEMSGNIINDRGWDFSAWVKSDNASSGMTNIDVAMAGLVLGFQDGGAGAHVWLDYMINYKGTAPSGSSTDNNGETHYWIYPEGSTAKGVTDTTWYELKATSTSTMRDAYAKSGLTDPQFNRIALHTYIDRAANTNAAYLSINADTLDVHDGIDNLNFLSDTFSPGEDWSGAKATAGTDNNEPSIGTDGSGNSYVAYERDGEIRVAKLDSGGTVSWDNPYTATANSQQDPEIAVDSSGNSYVVWEDNRDGSSDWDIYAQKINSSGTAQWTANGVAVEDTVNNHTDPDIDVDSSGNSYIVWEDNFGTDYIKAQKLDSSGSAVWTGGDETVGTGGAGANLDVSNPAISLDSSGNSYYVWEKINSSTYSIQAQKLNNPSGDPPNPSTQWTEVTIHTASGLDSDNPDIATDDSGTSYVVWDKLLDANISSYTEIFAQELNSSGVEQWNGGTDFQVTDTDYRATRQYPRVALNSSDLPVVVWQDLRWTSSYNVTKYSNIFGAELTGAGAETWDYPFVTTYNEVHEFPTIASSGSNYYIAWELNATQDDVYALQATDYAWSMGTGNWQIDGAVTADYASNAVVDYSLDVMNNDGTTVSTNCASGNWSSASAGAQEFSITSISPGSCSGLTITDKRIRVNFNFNGTDDVPLEYHATDFTTDPQVTTGTVVPENVWVYIAIIPIVPFIVRWFRNRRKYKGRKNPKPKKALGNF